MKRRVDPLWPRRLAGVAASLVVVGAGVCAPGWVLAFVADLFPRVHP